MDNLSLAQYSMGFAFDNQGRIALILKNKPKFLAGFWSGIGGHIEKNEDPADAMVREFYEETGIFTEKSKWVYLNPFVEYDPYKLSILAVFTICTDEIENVRTTTDEEVKLFTILDTKQLALSSDSEFFLKAALSLKGNKVYE